MVILLYIRVYVLRVCVRACTRLYTIFSRLPKRRVCANGASARARPRDGIKYAIGYGGCEDRGQ